MSIRTNKLLSNIKKTLILYNKYIQLIFIAAIVIISLVIRLDNYSYPLNVEDGNSEYIVAKNIFIYHEYPLVGDIASNFIALRHSPLYFYFLSSLLSINNNIITLGIINIILQTSTIIIIYLIAKIIFDKFTAVIAMIVFSSNSTILQTSSYFWQPFMVQPFINLSYLILILGYTRKSLFLLFSSTFLVILSGAIYFPGLFQLPFFVLIICYFIKKNKFPPILYLYLITTITISFLLFYSSVFVYYVKSLSNLQQLVQSGYTNHTFSVSFFIDNLMSIISFLSHTFFFTNSYLKITLIIGLLFFYINIHTHRAYPKNRSIIVWLLLLGYILIISLYSETELSLFRHLIPVYGIFVILLCARLTILYNGYRYIRYCLLILIAIYFFTLFPFLDHNNPLGSNIFVNKNQLQPGAKAIAASLQQDQYLNIHNFQIQTYRNEGRYDYGDALLLVPLETILHTKLTAVDNTSNVVYRQTNQPLAIYLICNKSSLNSFSLCIKSFSQQNSEYTYIHSIYTDSQSNITLFKKHI